MKELINGLIELMRPAEWTKSLGNMIVAVVFAGFLYGIKFDFFIFAQGCLSLFLLWSGLYTLNDYTDRKDDASHPFKKNRPIPSGRVNANIALAFSISLIFIAFVLAYFVNNLLLVCTLCMFVNHIFYTMKPFNFKKRPIVDLISGSLVNPVFRFYSGWVLFVPSFNAPLLPLIMILGLQFGGYGLYRMMSKDFEEKKGYKSTIVLVGPKIRYVFYLSIFIGALAYVLACINSILGFYYLGFLPFHYLLLVLLSVPFVPIYLPVLKEPNNVNTHGKHKKIYILLYAHAFVFFTMFFLLYFIS
ncbi:MAG: UbiA family prenyltransferase [Candidatus Diapherotrites archaeon]